MTDVMTIKDVLATLRCGRTLLRKLRTRPDFPRPLPQFRHLRWRRGDIEAWIERANDFGPEPSAAV